MQVCFIIGRAVQSSAKIRPRCLFAVEKIIRNGEKLHCYRKNTIANKFLNNEHSMLLQQIHGDNWKWHRNCCLMRPSPPCYSLPSSDHHLLKSGSSFCPNFYKKHKVVIFDQSKLLHDQLRFPPHIFQFVKLKLIL